MKNSKKLFIKTFGCQMNVYDSLRMADLLMQDGYSVVNDINDADVVIINTCHIREKAKERIFAELGHIKPIKQSKIKEGGYLVVIIAGCVAKAEGAEIFKRTPIVDIVVGGESYQNLPVMVREVLEGVENDNKKQLVDLEFNSKEKFASLPNTRIIKGISEFIAIQSGCDKFCSYI